MRPTTLLPAFTLCAERAAADLQYKGADISSLPMLESQRKTYKWTNGYVEAFEWILKKSGAISARQRVWVNPSDGIYNLDYNVKRAKRAKASGMSVYLDLHYSNTWADPVHQTTPKDRKKANIGELTNNVYQYTLSVCDRFASEGVNPAIISIGNLFSIISALFYRPTLMLIWLLTTMGHPLEPPLCAGQALPGPPNYPG